MCTQKGLKKYIDTWHASPHQKIRLLTAQLSSFLTTWVEMAWGKHVKWICWSYMCCWSCFGCDSCVSMYLLTLYTLPSVTITQLLRIFLRKYTPKQVVYIEVGYQSVSHYSIKPLYLRWPSDCATPLNFNNSSTAIVPVWFLMIFV